MTIEEFEKNLLETKLSKKEFAELTKLPYQTVMNWKRNNNAPDWVESWLQNYIDKKKFDNIKEIIKDEL